MAYDAGGQELSRNELKSASGSIRLVAEPEETAVKAGNIVYIPISLVGQNGVLERNADCKLTAAVENGELLAFGSANPRTEERYDSGNFTTYYGCAMAIVRAGQAGTVTLSVKNENQTAMAAIEVK